MKNAIIFLILNLFLCTSLTLFSSETSPEINQSSRPFIQTTEKASYYTEMYRNIFKEADYTDKDINNKLQSIWEQLFYGNRDQKVYFPADKNNSGSLAYIKDIGNNDVRSEGMSYGMMITVQMDKPNEFNALWNWTKTYMQHKEGARKGYFAWQCDKKGEILDPNSASDGEEYFATALFFASGRWGNGKGIYNYQKEANEILDTMLHKEDMNNGIVDEITNMFNKTNKQVVFVPCGNAATFTDPSYHLPAFYELWSRWADGYKSKKEDRNFWKDAAEESRIFFTLCTNSTTALNPDYANFDGSQIDNEEYKNHRDFRFDAWRTAMNWSLDYAWFNKNENAVELNNKLQDFFRSKGIDKYGNQYSLDGKTEYSSDHSAGLVAMNAVTSLTSTHENLPKNFINDFWNTPIPTGQWRYYDGMLYFLSYLILSGNYKIYTPEEFR
jgi:oligosaccharide reducing-end xylanase